MFLLIHRTRDGLLLFPRVQTVHDKCSDQYHDTDAHEPNLLIMKSCIRYMYKESDSKNGGGDGNLLRDADLEE